MRRVVITGLGVISPIGIGKEAFWRNLCEGVSGATTLDRVTCCELFAHQAFTAQVVCEVPAFRPDEHNIPPAYQSMDRFIQFALIAAQQAIQDAHVDLDLLDPTRTGVTVATAICGSQTMEREFVKASNWGKEPVQALEGSSDLYAAARGNSAALAIASRYGLQGECTTISTGCIGGLDAVGYAYESIALGDHEVMIAGGAEAPITPLTIAAFDIINCISRHTEKPRMASRPFSKHRDGFVLSEGSGVLVLEEMEHARYRQAPIYAEIVGWDGTEHGMHMTDMSPGGRDLVRAIHGALRQANCEPTDIGFVNAHGTSTRQNDYNETLALKAALGEHAYSIPINSTKSMLGHALAAASAIEVVVCALSLQAQRIHPTINLDEPDPACDLDYVPNTSRSHAMHTLLTTACGFSGLQAAMVMERV